MSNHYSQVKIVIKDLGDYMWRSPSEISVIEPSEKELDQAVREAADRGIKEIKVYLSNDIDSLPPRLYKMVMG